MPCRRPDAPGFALQTSGNEPRASGSECGAPGYEPGVTDSEDGAPGSELGARGSEDGAPGSELGARGSEDGVPGSELGARGSEDDVPGSERGARCRGRGAGRRQPGAQHVERDAPGFLPDMSGWGLDVWRCKPDTPRSDPGTWGTGCGDLAADRRVLRPARGLRRDGRCRRMRLPAPCSTWHLALAPHPPSGHLLPASRGEGIHCRTGSWGHRGDRVRR